MIRLVQLNPTMRPLRAKDDNSQQQSSKTRVFKAPDADRQRPSRREVIKKKRKKKIQHSFNLVEHYARHGTLWEIRTLCFIHEAGQIIHPVTQTYAISKRGLGGKTGSLSLLAGLTRSGENGCFLSSYMSPCNATAHIAPSITHR